MNKDVTFLINSCDKYKDAWHPFFECLRIFNVPTEYEMILNTETMQYNSDYFNVRTVNTPEKCTWSGRLMNVLNQINTEFVFFLLDDFFLKHTFDEERFKKVIAFMKENPDVGYVDLAPRFAETAEEGEYNKIRYKDTVDEFKERTMEKYNITCSPALWRTESLKSILRTHEDIWQFEYYAGIRAKKQGMKVVRFFTRTPTIYEHDSPAWLTVGITSGKWHPKTTEFFNELGINVDYEGLGILTETSWSEIRKSHIKSPKTVIRIIKRKIRTRLDRNKSLK